MRQSGFSKPLIFILQSTAAPAGSICQRTAVIPSITKAPESLLETESGLLLWPHILPQVASTPCTWITWKFSTFTENLQASVSQFMLFLDKFPSWTKHWPVSSEPCLSFLLFVSFFFFFFFLSLPPACKIPRPEIEPLAQQWFMPQKWRQILILWALSQPGLYLVL